MTNIPASAPDPASREGGGDRLGRESPRSPTIAATVDADNPWPGLFAFREADQDYFKGRREETEDLRRLVMRGRLSVFFGLSGLGKSSLLQAGLFALFPRPETVPSGSDSVAFVTYLADHPTFQNTLMTASESRQFQSTYTGWGCLERIVALIEYTDPARAPTVATFDMCRLLGWVVKP